MQMEARKWANEFNKQGVPKPVSLDPGGYVKKLSCIRLFQQYPSANVLSSFRPNNIPDPILTLHEQVDFLVSTVVVLVNRDTRPTGTMERYPSFPLLTITTIPTPSS